jgi:predicted nucleotidyltransferase
MDKNTVIGIARQYAALVRKRFPVKTVLLYGSYARGNYYADSDIDIAVIVDKFDVDFWAEYTELFKLRRSIDSRIEPVLLEAHEDPSGFLKSILEYGEVIAPTAA